MARRKKRWIRGAVERPGRVRRYLRRKYGDKAFKRDGTIKVTYIDRALRQPQFKRRLKRGSRQHSLRQALILARRFASR